MHSFIINIICNVLTIQAEEIILGKDREIRSAEPAH